MSAPRLEITRSDEPAILAIDGREFAVRIGADLDTDVMAAIVDLDVEFRRHGMRKPGKVAEWTRRARALVMEVIEKEHPDPDDLAWVKTRSLTASELFQMLRFMSANPDGPIAEAADALSDGGEADGEGGTTDPTKSPRRSRSRSSRSARRSTSAPGTGEGSDGETSASTSATAAAA